MLKVRVVEPRTHEPAVCELPMELHPPHEVPPLMSMTCAEATDGSAATAATKRPPNSANFDRIKADMKKLPD
jgi:hypothetical protein